MSATVEEKIRAAANDALVRLFPRFKEADSSFLAWEAAMKRAKEGADQPFQPTGHTDATEKHPVCQQVLTTIGAGKSGNEIRKALQASPFGWPKDAVNAALIALHRSQHITATLNSNPVALGQLDQNKISKAEFRVEQTTLSVQDRLAMRKLFQKLSISCKSGEESAAAHQFLSGLIDLARSAGGDAPLPACPAVTDLEDLQRLVGNEQLRAIKDRSADLESKITSWTALRDLANTRKPVWDIVVRLARQAKEISEAQPHLTQIDAVRDQRLLLQPTDPVAPLRVALGECLRSAVNTAHDALAQAAQQALTTLEANDVWKKLPAGDREAILPSVGLVVPAKPGVSSDEALVSYLESRPLVAARTEVDAVPGRLQQAIEQAAKRLEPQVQTVALERTTLRNEADVQAWLDRTKAKLLQAVQQGPVLVK